MNVDIKNALDKLLLVCNHIQTNAPAGSSAKNIRDLVIADIFSFIGTISIAKADDRKALFAKTYLDGAVYTEPAGALAILCQVDNNASAMHGLKASALYISFLFELGRHYTLSKHDKRDIDVTKFAMHIKQLNDYVSSHSIVSTKKSEQVEVTADCKELVAQVAVETTPSGNLQDAEPEESLEELLAQLHGLIGLYGVKEEVNSLINLLKMKQLRDARGRSQGFICKNLFGWCGLYRASWCISHSLSSGQQCISYAWVESICTVYFIPV